MVKIVKKEPTSFQAHKYDPQDTESLEQILRILKRPSQRSKNSDLSLRVHTKFGDRWLLPGDWLVSTQIGCDVFTDEQLHASFSIVEE